RGMIMLHCTEPWAAAGFTPEDNSLAAVITNPNLIRSRQRLRLPAFVPRGRGSAERRRIQAVLTEPDRRRVFVPVEVEVQEAAGCLELLVEVPPKGICSVLVPKVSLFAGKSSVEQTPMDGDPMDSDQAGKQRKHSHDKDSGVTVQMVSAMARAAADGAALERWLGQADLQTVHCWSRWEHECGCAAAALEAIPPATPPADSGFADLMEAICAGAWGAANERKYGAGNQDATQSWERFGRHIQRLADTAALSSETAQELKWYVFNVCWMMVNLRWYGPGSTDHHEAAERAAHHFRELGGADNVILRRWR
ncbi:unnamed protein product, partial [Symbiodinium microadriaticum]